MDCLDRATDCKNTAVRGNIRRPIDLPPKIDLVPLEFSVYYSTGTRPRGLSVTFICFRNSHAINFDHPSSLLLDLHLVRGGMGNNGMGR